MKSFREWDEGGRRDSEAPIIRRIATTFRSIDGLEREIESLLDQLSRDHGPVRMAMEQFRRSLEVLKATIRTAVVKHKENPERADHPPRSL